MTNWKEPNTHHYPQSSDHALHKCLGCHEPISIGKFCSNCATRLKKQGAATMERKRKQNVQ